MPLTTDLALIKQRTADAEDENVRFRQFVKYRLPWSEGRVDDVVHRINDEVTAGIDCTACANCCKILKISLTEEDIARIADHLGIGVEEARTRYAAPDPECGQIFAASPCVFLENDRCSIYPARPRDCREYPHLHKPQFRTRMWGVLGNAEDCPIVYNVLERLKKELRR